MTPICLKILYFENSFLTWDFLVRKEVNENTQKLLPLLSQVQSTRGRQHFKNFFLSRNAIAPFQNVICYVLVMSWTYHRWQWWQLFAMVYFPQHFLLSISLFSTYSQSPFRTLTFLLWCYSVTTWLKVWQVFMSKSNA